VSKKLDQVRAAAERRQRDLERAEGIARKANERLMAAVERARADHPMDEIAKAAGVSRQMLYLIRRQVKSNP